jgi:hypothetical protein
LPSTPPRRRWIVAKRDIERALRKNGVTAERIEYVWTITPEEHVPCWEVHLSDADADKFGEDHMHIFDNTTQALEWVEQLEPYSDPANATMIADMSGEIEG